MPLLIRLYIKFELDFEANTSLSTNTPSQSKINAGMGLFKLLGADEGEDRRTRQTVRHKKTSCALALKFGGPVGSSGVVSVFGSNIERIGGPPAGSNQTCKPLSLGCLRAALPGMGKSSNAGFPAVPVCPSVIDENRIRPSRK